MKTIAVGLVLASLALPLAAQAAGDPAAGKSKAQACAGCHGADGNSPTGQFPNLAGQHASYIVKQLEDFKAGKTRRNEVMAPIVANLSHQDMEDLAAYFAAQTPAGGSAEEQYVERGAQIYRGGDPENNVAACMACHSPRGAGNPMAAYPRLAGQHAEYTVKQLQAFRSTERSNDPNAMMRTVTHFMSEEEMKAVAEYISGLH